MKKLTTAVSLALAALILLSFSGCLKYTGNILEVTRPGTEIPAFTTDVTPLGETTALYVDPAVTQPGVTDPAATTVPALPEATTVPAQPAGANDPATWTVQQIVDYVNKCVSQTRAYTGNLNANHKETITVNLTKLPGGTLIQNLANQIVSSAVKPTDETLTFSNGQAVDTEGDTVPIILPKKASFSLDANGVAAASARADGTDTVVDITLVKEVGTLEAAPPYNAAAIGYLNAGMVDLSAVTVTTCDITYPGSTMKLRINQGGYVVTADYNVPFSIQAAGKAMFISAEVECEGNDSESWVLLW